MKTILAPVDFSAVTRAVVNQAGSLAAALRARVVLVTVVQPPMITSDYAPVLENLAAVAAAADHQAAKQLTLAQATLRRRSIPTKTVQVHGPIVPLLLEQAKKHSADYIVMGLHGHTVLYDLLVGSTTHGVLTRSRCPVLIVPANRKPRRSPARRT